MWENAADERKCATASRLRVFAAGPHALPVRYHDGLGLTRGRRHREAAFVGFVAVVEVNWNETKCGKGEDGGEEVEDEEREERGGSDGMHSGQGAVRGLGCVWVGKFSTVRGSALFTPFIRLR